MPPLPETKTALSEPDIYQLGQSVDLPLHGIGGLLPPAPTSSVYAINSIKYCSSTTGTVIELFYPPTAAKAQCDNTHCGFTLEVKKPDHRPRFDPSTWQF